jgi:hypothetical protein
MSKSMAAAVAVAALLSAGAPLARAQDWKPNCPQLHNSEMRVDVTVAKTSCKVARKLFRKVGKVNPPRRARVAGRRWVRLDDYFIYTSGQRVVTFQLVAS